MPVYPDRATVTRHDRLARCLGRLKAGAPSRMCNVHNHARPVHLSDGCATEVTDARVGRFRATIAEDVSPVIGEVHHADAELEKQADVCEFFGAGIPLLSERDAVAGEIEAMSPLLLRRLDVGWCHRSRHAIAQHIREIGAIGQTLQQSQRRAALFPRSAARRSRQKHSRRPGIPAAESGRRRHVPAASPCKGLRVRDHWPLPRSPDASCRRRSPTAGRIHRTPRRATPHATPARAGALFRSASVPRRLRREHPGSAGSSPVAGAVLPSDYP